jgi:hypothetical protein
VTIAALRVPRSPGPCFGKRRLAGSDGGPVHKNVCQIAAYILEPVPLDILIKGALSAAKPVASSCIERTERKAVNALTRETVSTARPSCPGAGRISQLPILG